MVRTVLVRCRLLAVLAAVTLMGLAAIAAAQDTGQAPDPAEMEAHMKAMTPGPHHAQLTKRVGNWKTHSKMWMQPGAPAMETPGTAKVEALLDGRFVQEVAKANMFGMPWEGRGVQGYDNVTGKHLGTWFDSFGTTMMSFEGTCDGTCKVVTTKGEYVDPMSKEVKVMKSVSTMKSADEYVLELYDIANDGSEHKMALITYVRDGETKAQAKR